MKISKNEDSIYRKATDRILHLEKRQKQVIEILEQSLNYNCKLCSSDIKHLLKILKER